MKTVLQIIPPTGEIQTVEVDMAPKPSLHDLEAVLNPYFGRAYTEHVNVLTNNGYTDMFVDEDGFSKSLSRNERATEIYRRNWMESHPNTEPEKLNFIVGTAIVFDRRVWF